MTATTILIIIATECFMVRAFKPMWWLIGIALVCFVMGLPPYRRAYRQRHLLPDWRNCGALYTMTDRQDRPIMMATFEHDVAAFGSLFIVVALYAWALLGG